MTEVIIAYNAFLNTMKIHIDGRPIPPVSRLTRFQTQPFERWCREIFPAIGDEVNDRFSVIYEGRPCESHILSAFMASSAFCNSYVNRQPEILDSALTRLKKLSSLCQSGVSCEKFSAAVHVYTELEEAEIAGQFKACLPKLAYCRILPKVHPLGDAAFHGDESPAFVICREGTAVPKIGARRGCVLTVGGNGGISCENGIFRERVRPEELEGLLKSYLELLLYPYLLNRALASVLVPESSPLYPSVNILNKTEPQTLVTLPSSIEFGETAQIRVRTIPEGAKAAELIYRISDETVIVQSGRGLKAVGTGEAVVEVYVAGQASKLCSGRITAHRRNRIQSIRIDQQEIEMHVGERATLTYTYTPKDADNVSCVKLVSSDGTVAAPEQGLRFVARRAGTCRMHVEAEKISDSIPVKVYPVLEGLKLEMDRTHVRTGEVVPLRVTRIPETATLDKLSYRVEPETLGIYDVATHSFYAKGNGKGRVTVSDKTGAVQSSCEVSVSGAPSGKGCLGSVAMAFLGLLALACIFII